MDKTDRKLLFSVTAKDLDIQTFTSGGPGGQHQNRAQTGVRIVHRESGAVGEAREERSQLQNKRAALKRMTQHPKFSFWVAQKRRELETGKTDEEVVAEQMRDENLFIEVVKNGKWVPDDES